MYRRSISLCLILVFAFTGVVYTIADETDAADSKSVWVTSIARLGETDQFVAATADGLLLREADVCSFNGSNPNELSPLYSHPAAVWCVAATSDGSKVASIDYRGNLGIFDTAGSEAVIHDKALERWCQAMLISPDDKSIVAGNEAGKVLVWDFESGKVAKTAELDGHAVTGLAISPDGSQLAASDGGGHVHLFQWPSLEPQGKFDVSEETVWCVAYVDEGKGLLIGSSDRHLYRAEPKADAKAESVAKGSDWITQLAVSPSGQVAAAEVSGKLHFPTAGATDSMKATSGVWSLCWNGDAQLFAGTRKDGIVIAGRSWRWTEPASPAKQEPAEKEPKDDKESAEPSNQEMKESKEEKKEESDQKTEPEAKADDKTSEKAKSKSPDPQPEPKKADAKPEAKNDAPPTKPAPEPKETEPKESEPQEAADGKKNE